MVILQSTKECFACWDYVPAVGPQSGTIQIHEMMLWLDCQNDLRCADLSLGVSEYSR